MSRSPLQRPGFDNESRSRAAAASVATPPNIPEQLLIRTIYEWGGTVAVITDKWMPSKERYAYSLATVDLHTSRIVPFVGVKCDSIHDVAYNEQLGKVLVCGRGDTARVYRLQGQAWRPLSDPVQGRAFRLAVDGDRIALISESAIYLISGSSTNQTVRIPAGIAEFPVAPSATLLTASALFIAYNRGEFGGGLFRFSLSEPVATPTKLLGDNVKFLARSKSGGVWAASGLGHMGYTHGALYRVAGPTSEVVAVVSADFFAPGDVRVSETSGIEFPGVTSVAGLTFGNDDQPIVVFPEFGVFELRDDHFVPLYRGPLNFSYRVSRMWVGSGPVGLVTNASGDIYVASRSLGVLLLRRNGNELRVKQLTFAR